MSSSSWPIVFALFAIAVAAVWYDANNAEDAHAQTGAQVTQVAKVATGK